MTTATRQMETVATFRVHQDYYALGKSRHWMYDCYSGALSVNDTETIDQIVFLEWVTFRNKRGLAFTVAGAREALSQQDAVAKTLTRR